MKRLLMNPLPEQGSLFQPSPEERRHLQDVRRTGVGEILEILNGSGQAARAEVVEVGRNRMTLKVLEWLVVARESPLWLSLGLAIPSQLSTFDTMLPGLVQLGVDEIVLAPTCWGGRIKKDPQRYQQRVVSIAEQALKQCGRLVVPKLTFLPSYEGMLDFLIGSSTCQILYHPVESETPLPMSCKRLALLVGPEGGFTEEEVADARVRGVRVKGLGPRILKMETAAIGACFQAQCRYGDLA